MKEKAFELFSNGYNCSQSVFMAYAEKMGLEEKEAQKISAGFGGGCGRTQKLCGALSGAIMTIGLKFCDLPDPIEAKEKTYFYVKNMIETFEEKYKYSDCLHLLEADMSTDEGKARIKNEDMHNTKCKSYIEFICDYLNTIL